MAAVELATVCTEAAAQLQTLRMEGEKPWAEELEKLLVENLQNCLRGGAGWSSLLAALPAGLPAERLGDGYRRSSRWRGTGGAAP